MNLPVYRAPELMATPNYAEAFIGSFERARDGALAARYKQQKIEQEQQDHEYETNVLRPLQQQKAELELDMARARATSYAAGVSGARARQASITRQAVGASIQEGTLLKSEQEATSLLSRIATAGEPPPNAPQPKPGAQPLPSATPTPARPNKSSPTDRQNKPTSPAPSTLATPAASTTVTDNPIRKLALDYTGQVARFQRLKATTLSTKAKAHYETQIQQLNEAALSQPALTKELDAIGKETRTASASQQLDRIVKRTPRGEVALASYLEQRPALAQAVQNGSVDDLEFLSQDLEDYTKSGGPWEKAMPAAIQAFEAKAAAQAAKQPAPTDKSTGTTTSEQPPKPTTLRDLPEFQTPANAEAAKKQAAVNQEWTSAKEALLKSILDTGINKDVITAAANTEGNVPTGRKTNMGYAGMSAGGTVEVDELAPPARALLIRQGLNPDKTLKVAGENRTYEDILSAALQELKPKKEPKQTSQEAQDKAATFLGVKK